MTIATINAYNLRKPMRLNRSIIRTGIAMLSLASWVAGLKRLWWYRTSPTASMEPEQSGARIRA